MNIFYDSSAWVKRYVREKGTDRVNQIYFDAERNMVSVLCMAETFSVLNRLIRQERLAKAEYSNLRKIIFQDFQSAHVCNVTGAVIQNTIDIFEKISLKSLDALQLACCLSLDADYFVSSDRKLLNAAEKFNLKVIRV